MKRIDVRGKVDGQEREWTFLTNEDGQSLFVVVDGATKRLDYGCGYDDPWQMKKAIRGWLSACFNKVGRLNYTLKFFD